MRYRGACTGRMIKRAACRNSRKIRYMHLLAVRNIMAVGMSVPLCLLMLCICTETVEIPKDWVQPLRAVCTEISRRNFDIPIMLGTSPPDTMQVS